MTNDPELIHTFVNCNRDQTLAKPFSPTVWKSDKADYVTRSAIVEPRLLPEDTVLQACPMIFQPYIEKDFEVRITCFRDILVGIRIDSQATVASRIDWRAVSPTRLGITRIDVPTMVEAACVTLLRFLDLEFACIDMIVTPRGDWVFLELNQMGQFLWIEQVSPDVPMLDLFVQLLTGTLLPGGKERVYGLRYSDFLPAAVAELRAEQPLRVPKAEVNVVIDP